MKKILLICIMLLHQFAYAQTNYTCKILAEGNETSFRGLSVVNDKIIWVSGSNGFIGKSLDGGTKWEFQQLYNFEKYELRDIEAFDENTAYVMCCQPASVFKTIDGGQTWKQVYSNDNTEAFLDGMDFWDINKGIVFGDPINNHFLVAITVDGKSFKEIDSLNIPAVKKGTAAFAASGTSIQCLHKGHAFFATGGTQSVLFYSDNYGYSWKYYETPMMSGYQSSGIYSIYFDDDKKGCIIGGDYTKDKSKSDNFYYTINGGKSWKLSPSLPFGYRSCITPLNDATLIACGTSGVDICLKDNLDWTSISQKNFNVVQHAKKGKAIFLAGNNGRIAKLAW